MSFEWRTDADEAWDDALTNQARKTVIIRHKARWLLGILLIVGVGGLIAYWQIDRRATAATNAIHADVIAAHTLVQQASDTQDLDLLEALIWSQSQSWYEIQQQLITQHLFLDRPSLGLWAQTAVVAPQVTLSTDLKEAEVIDLLPYVVPNPEGTLETVQLMHTTVYRQKDNAWLLAPPTDSLAFWGRWLTTEGEHIELIYPERDAAIGSRLAEALDLVLQDVCRQPAIGCPPNFTLQLRFVRHHDSLIQLNQGYPIFRVRAGYSEHTLTLPTPTLIGYPQDEAGYHALYRAYGSWIVASFIANFHAHTFMTYETLNQQLTQWDLFIPQSDSWPKMAFADPPIPLPDQDIQILCTSFPPAQLIRYNPVTQTWVDELAAREDFRFMRESLTLFADPNDKGVFLYGRQAVESLPRWRTYYWWQGQETLVFDSDVAHALNDDLTFRVSKEGRYLPVFLFRDFDDQNPTNNLLTLDLHNCHNEGCTTVDIDGWAYWSPDQTQTIVTSPRDGKLHLGDSQGQIIQSLQAGWAPIWLDNQSYAYIHYNPASAEQEIAAAVLGDTPSTQTLLTSADFLTAIPTTDSGPDKTAIITYLYTNPIHPRQIFINVRFTAGENYLNSQLFLFDMDTERLEALFTLYDRFNEGPHFTPNGRYISFLGYNKFNTGLSIYNVEDRTQFNITTDAPTFPPHTDWSANGQWLLIVDTSMIRLMAPEYEYEIPIFHNFEGCSTAAWVQRLPTK